MDAFSEFYFRTLILDKLLVLAASYAKLLDFLGDFVFSGNTVSGETVCTLVMPFSLLSLLPRYVQGVLDSFKLMNPTNDGAELESFELLMQCIQSYRVAFCTSADIAEMVVNNKHCPRYLTRQLESQFYNKTALFKIYTALLQLVEPSIEGRATVNTYINGLIFGGEGH